MNVVFYNKDFSRTAQPSAEITVDRYSWNMIGGPSKAYLKAIPNADKWEMMKLLRAPIEIYGDDGEIVWWGFVNRVTVPFGEKQRLGLGLNELFNYVIVTYSEGDSSAGSDANSISAYGQKEKLLTDTSLSETNGDAKRDLYLLDHKYAKPEIEFSGGNEEVVFECYGWYSTLGWKYYAKTTTSDGAHETQIENIVTADGQFLDGTIVEDASGLTSNQFRDGRKTALTYINQLLSAGTDNTQPYLAYVDKNRYLHVYERAAQPSSPEYLLREDGKLITPLGRVVPDQKCKVAAWVKPKGVPDTLGGFSAMSMFFIESAEYNVAQDKITYRAAGAYEQIRLGSYVAAIVTGESGTSDFTTSGITGGGNVDVPDFYYGFGGVSSFLELYSTAWEFTTDSMVVEWDDVLQKLGAAIFYPYVTDKNFRLTVRGFYMASFQLELTDLTEGDEVFVDANPFNRANDFATTYANADGDARLTFSCLVYRSESTTGSLTIYAKTGAWISKAYLQLAYLGYVDMGIDIGSP